MNTVQAFDMFEAARIGRIRASSQQALPSARAGIELVGNDDALRLRRTQRSPAPSASPFCDFCAEFII